jgi:hypothetical protein
MIQISTVNRSTDPSDYWSGDFFRTVEFEDNTMGKGRTAHVARTESVENVIESAEHDNFIVTTEPELMYDHPNADTKVEVYDGYNE